MKNISKIDINKITRTGKYVDFENSEIFTLTPEEVKALRKYHNNPHIAADYNFDIDKPIVEEPKAKPRKPETLPPMQMNNRKFSIAKDRNKYNYGYQTKTTPKIKYGYRLLIGSLVIILGVGFIWNLNTEAANKKNPLNVPPLPAKPEESIEIIIDTPTNTDFDELDDMSVYYSSDSSSKSVDNLSYERDIIQKYCDIYHINSDVVFSKLAALTDNFTSDDFLTNFHIPGVTCKGEEVFASSEEEILLYAIRAMKQLPDQLDVDTTNLFINNNYQSSTDYCSQIDYISQVMGVDRCLVYAICKAECNFKSDLFLNANNPAGLRMDGSWWHFDTAEEGFIETCAEIIKYYRKIGKPLTDTSYTTLSQIGAIHAPIEDGNDLWLDNVWSIYNEAKKNETELFGSTNNRFSK